MKRIAMIASLAGMLASCGGGGGSGEDGESGSWAQVFLQDAPAEDLDSFVLTITKVTLVGAGGGEVVLFSGSMEEDLLDLVMIQELIASAPLPPGTYTGLVLDVAAIVATANGTIQTVASPALPAGFTVQFENPVALLPGSTASIFLDFDVEDSVDDGGGDSILVSPVIFADVRTKHVDLNDFEGIVQSVGEGSFVVQVIESSGPGGAEPVGFLTVQWEDADELAPGMKVEVEGAFANGAVVASEVEIEDNGDGSEGFDAVVLSVSGSSGVVRALDGAPVDVNVHFGSADVVIGERVELEGAFSGGVFVATAVASEKTRFRGTISAAGSASVTLSPLTAERLSIAGLASRTFAVTAQTEITIDDVFAVGLSDLAAGQSVKIKALRSGSVWTALEIEREGDEIEGFRSQVTAIGSGSFVLDGVTVQWSAATELVLVADGGSTDLAPSDFAATLASLPGSAKIKVEGVGSGSTMAATEIVLLP